MRLKKRILRTRDILHTLIEKFDIELEIIELHLESEPESSQVEFWQDNWKATYEKQKRVKYAFSILEDIRLGKPVNIYDKLEG